MRVMCLPLEHITLPQALNLNCRALGHPAVHPSRSPAAKTVDSQGELPYKKAEGAAGNFKKNS